MSGKTRNPARIRAVWLGLVTGAILLAASCGPATVAFREGQKAEQQKDYDTAIIHFDKALRYQPDNPRFQIWERDARAKAAAAHLQRGRQLLAMRRSDEAAAEFQKAVDIDPSNLAAAQELQRILLQKSAAEQRREAEIRRGMERAEETQGTGVVQLKPLPPQSIPTLRLGPADARVVFETLAKLAGINVVFYYEFQPKQISLNLTEVTISDALKAAAQEAHVFWVAITPNTILVVPDTPSNRRELEPRVMRTVYLQNPLTSQTSTAILTAVRTLMQTLGQAQMAAVEDTESNSITIYDTPDRVRQAVELIHNLDRGKAEVLIDVAVIEADRDRIRDLGLTTVPLSSSAGTQAAVALNPSLIPGATGTTSATGPPLLGLNRLGRISTNDFSIALPGVIANALMSDTRTRILQHPNLLAEAGEDATLKIGQSIPLATGSFGIPTATSTSTTAGFGLLANTQFNYRDVGVNLKITPWVAGNGDVILKSDVEISAVGPSTNIGGIEEPTFTQRTVTATERLKEGQSNLVGGLIQTQTTNAVSGLPGLARIPILKYFFSTTNVEITDEEVVILLTPHVVRLPDAAVAADNPPASAAPVSAPLTQPPAATTPHGVQQ